jgi:NMD protein affecting ribosome stability and mRNA decay
MLDRLPRNETRKPREVDGVEGYCRVCRGITRNRLLLVGNLMKARCCEECGAMARPGPRLLAECYLDEFVDRLGELVKAAKPVRLQSRLERLHEIPAEASRMALREVAYLDDLFLRSASWPKKK